MVIKQLSGAERLVQLDLSAELIGRVLSRADQETEGCTPLDPPILQGLLRWGRTTRFLREELIPVGWSQDNPRNLARTIHPSGDFAIVVATGGVGTGLTNGDPGTRHRKGNATSEAVRANNQLSFDLGPLVYVERAVQEVRSLLPHTWLLLFLVDGDVIRAELSLPAAFEDGRITEWLDRILLPAVPRDRAAMGAADIPLGRSPTGIPRRLFDEPADDLEEDWLDGVNCDDEPPESTGVCLTGDTLISMATVDVGDRRSRGGPVQHKVVGGESVSASMDGSEFAEIRPKSHMQTSATELMERRRHLPVIDFDWLPRDLDPTLDPRR
jgi:hypothetical protein